MAKVVIVTGVSRGIGRAVVEALFALDGDTKVAGVARSETPLRQLQEQYGEHRFQYVVGDVSETDTVERLVQAAAAAFGRIDSVVANAGVLAPVQDVHRLDTAAWKRLFDVNFFSIVTLVSHTIEHLARTRGSLIFVSSGASVKPYHGWGAYGASKAALNHLAMTVASESRDVRAIAVAPGVVDTQMQVDIRETLGPRGMTPEALQRFTDLKQNGGLVASSVPAAVYARLALLGVPDALNGEYVRYNDARLGADKMKL